MALIEKKIMKMMMVGMIISLLESIGSSRLEVSMLIRSLKNSIPLNQADPSSFYSVLDRKGYNDYPFPDDFNKEYYASH